jgi:hypothetical protein
MGLMGRSRKPKEKNQREWSDKLMSDGSAGEKWGGGVNKRPAIKKGRGHRLRAALMHGFDYETDIKILNCVFDASMTEARI